MKWLHETVIKRRKKMKRKHSMKRRRSGFKLNQTDPEKNVPEKEDDDNDYTRPKPGITDPKKNDPTRIEEPEKTDPTRKIDPDKTNHNNCELICLLNSKRFNL
jgi:hypothetical protein